MRDHMNFRSAGTVDFLYKPLYSTHAVPDNAEFDSFAEERADELTRADALALHNDFWQCYPVLYGNVYGAIPIKALDAVQYALLVRFGWKPVRADLVFFRRGLDADAKRRIAERYFERHIMVDATEYTPTMLFYFRI